MEAVAALGLASNVLQLIECGYKVVVMAKELHESGQEATYSNNNASFVAQELQELSLRVMKQLPTSDPTDDEKALCRLAEQCKQLSNKLLVLLDSLKIKKSGGKFDLLTGVLRNIRKKRERDQLQADLDNYRQQLNVQINRMSHSDLARRLDETLSTASMTQQGILHLRDQVRKLQQASRIDSANMADFFHKLQRAVETPLEYLAILERLRDPRMLSRFENVDTAHRKTFEWLLQGPGTSQRDEQTVFETKYRKHKEFIAWLEEDLESSLTDPHKHITGSLEQPSLNAPRRRSIFRISGKPGAGKSTLMKFICENDITHEKLKAWSGDKQLICAKAFFWRFGDDEQKNLAGLTKSLLYQILKAAPRLIPVAFPQEATNRMALNILLGSPRAFESHKMIFFIDGLDEFDGRPLELIQEIIGWTKKSSENLKICVSSREWNEFEVGFGRYPSLRIHELTYADIKNFVMDRFNEIEELSTLVDGAKLGTLAEVVVIKAEGVFLWVRVVLAAIEQGVLNGDDFEDLREKVDAFPTELKDLYQYLLNSIPERDRQKAFETLIFTYHRACSLLQYKFLSDLSRDSNFARNMTMEPLPEKDLRRHLANTRRQINGRCKGFLEIRPAMEESFRGDEVVSFMHSTVYEFLEQPKTTEIIKPYIHGINMLDRLCQAFIAFAKSIDTDQFYNANPPKSGESWEKECLFIYEFKRIVSHLFTKGVNKRIPMCYTSRSTDQFLDFLDQVDVIATQRLRIVPENRGGVFLRNKIILIKKDGYYTYSPSSLFVSPVQVVKVLAAQGLIFEYFGRDGHCDLRALHETNPSLMNLIVNAVFSGVSGQLYHPRAFQMLEILLKAGVSPNVRVDIPDRDDTPDRKRGLWSWIIRRLFLRVTLEEESYMSPDEPDVKGHVYRLTELGLRYGAVVDLNLVLHCCYEVIGTDELIVQIKFGESDEEQAPISFRTLFVDCRLDIVRYARTKNGFLTFKDLLAYCFPQNYDHLYTLLDKKGLSSLETEPTEFYTSLPVMPILFPEKYLYRYDGKVEAMAATDDAERRLCKTCLAHSEKCFEEFEARLQGKGLGHVGRGANVPIF
ncbi:hypothetical protein F4805DRAFT_448534 [Annulohypoxylon moriforme]|nr:hypothetical protein F4805DRAFT_448534 [Annulohypoxylon moriforme]